MRFLSSFLTQFVAAAVISITFYIIWPEFCVQIVNVLKFCIAYTYLPHDHLKIPQKVPLLTYNLLAKYIGFDFGTFTM